MKKQFWILVPHQFQSADKEEVLMSFIDPDSDDRETIYLTKEVAEEEQKELNKRVNPMLGLYEVKSVTIEIED